MIGLYDKASPSLMKVSVKAKGDNRSEPENGDEMWDNAGEDRGDAGISLSLCVIGDIKHSGGYRGPGESTRSSLCSIVEAGRGVENLEHDSGDGETVLLVRSRDSVFKCKLDFQPFGIIMRDGCIEVGPSGKSILGNAGETSGERELLFSKHSFEYGYPYM